MANPKSKYKNNIIKLNKEGITNIEISRILGCTKSTVAYHLNLSTKNFARDRSRERRKRIKTWFKELTKNDKCTICKETERLCLDYHHIFPEDKRQEMSSLVNEMFSKEIILKEYNKCICLCSNCHRKVHGKLIDLENYL